MRLRTFLTLSVASMMLAACGGAAGTTTTSTAQTTTTTAAPVTTTTTTVPETTTTTAQPTVETVFGHLRSFEGTDDGSIVVGVDEATMLSGEEAVAAAREDGVIGQDEDLPNDYYIRDPDDTVVEFVLSPNAEIVLQATRPDGPVTQETVDVETWSILLGGEEDPGLDWTWYGAGYLPYWFDVRDGVIVHVEEQYLP